MQPTLRRWWPVVAMLALIFYLSAQSGSSVGIPAPWDKLAHATEYAFLSFLISRASNKPLFAWLLATIWGATDEYHQSFVPNREAGIPDWIADVVGSGIGAWVYTKFLKEKKQNPVRYPEA